MWRGCGPWLSVCQLPSTAQGGVIRAVMPLRRDPWLAQGMFWGATLSRSTPCAMHALPGALGVAELQGLFGLALDLCFASKALETLLIWTLACLAWIFQGKDPLQPIQQMPPASPARHLFVVALRPLKFKLCHKPPPSITSTAIALPPSVTFSNI